MTKRTHGTCSRCHPCPQCGEMAHAKVACRECRAKARGDAPPCSACGRSVKLAWGGRCPMCVQRARVPAQCASCGEQRQIAALGLCGTCYSRDYRAKHGRRSQADAPRRVLVKWCEFCGGEIRTTESRTRFCGSVCGNAERNGWSRSKDVAVRPLVRVWHGQSIRGGRFTAGPCAECGEAFVAADDARYCSEVCSKRASWRRRYERRGVFSVPARTRSEIYERDAWTCQLCFAPVDGDLPVSDRMSATLDHIIPQSHQLVPDHSPSNLRLAHRICNSLRGDGSREVDYGQAIEALRDVRGLSATSA